VLAKRHFRAIDLPIVFILNRPDTVVSQCLCLEAHSLTSTWKEPKLPSNTSALSSYVRDLHRNTQRISSNVHKGRNNCSKPSKQLTPASRSCHASRSTKTNSLAWSVPLATRPRNLPQLLATFQFPPPRLSLPNHLPSFKENSIQDDVLRVWETDLQYVFPHFSPSTL
jgi:hypothetical protein